MNAENQKIIAHVHAKKESHEDVYSWFENLKKQGLNPLYITMDGEKTVMRAVKQIWPHIKIQRCLFHIKREGLRWLRSYPKTQAGRDLKELLSHVCSIRNIKERNRFIRLFNNWWSEHKNYICSLPSKDIAYRDLKKTVTLIKNALSDMFYFLVDPKVHSTGNALEGFHSRIKLDYPRHRGISKEHRKSYLNWYCYFKNGQK